MNKKLKGDVILKVVNGIIDIVFICKEVSSTFYLKDKYKLTGYKNNDFFISTI